MRLLYILIFFIINSFFFNHCKASNFITLSEEEKWSRCILLRSSAKDFIRKERKKEALNHLMQAAEYVTCIFDICKICILLYELEHYDFALSLLNQTLRFEFPHMFEIKEAIELLETHHSEQEDLISTLKRKLFELSESKEATP